MYDLMFHRKSGFLLGILLLATAVIGAFLFFPIVSLYLPYDHTHVGILVPSIGRKGYVYPTYDASISGDGQLVAYTSTANSLRYGNSGSSKGLFLYNRDAAETRQVSTGLWHPFVSLENPKISENGKFIAFFAVTYNKTRDAWPTAALHLYDISTQTTKEVPLPEGIGLDRTNDMKFSQDGRFLWFQAWLQGYETVLLHDQVANTTTSLSNLLFAPSSNFAIEEVEFVSDDFLLFTATDGHTSRYGVYEYAQMDYRLIPPEQYEELSISRLQELPGDIRKALTYNSHGELLALSTDQNTAVVSIAANVENLGDFDLTSNLYQLDRSTGELSRIPTPNWKRSAFLILSVMNTIVAGYILLTDAARSKRPFAIP
ncbi:MAG: hypothetical protein IPM53_30965 [Anaerolineaceae bacterium]|nr:hypothetical protein [Anaerolineaceae bacterium]